MKPVVTIELRQADGDFTADVLIDGDPHAQVTGPDPFRVAASASHYAALYVSEQGAPFDGLRGLIAGAAKKGTA